MSVKAQKTSGAQTVLDSLNFSGESLIPGLAYFYVSPKLDEVKWLIDRPASVVRVAMMLVICRLAYVNDCLSFWQLMVAGPSEIFGCSHDGDGMRRRYSWRVWRCESDAGWADPSRLCKRHQGLVYDVSRAAKPKLRDYPEGYPGPGEPQIKKT